MKLLVFGATGGTGKQLVEQALQQGHVVTAFARDPGRMKLAHDNLRVVRGDILQPNTIETAMARQDAVLSALGTRLPIRIVLLTVVVSQIIVRTVALSRLVSIFVEVGVPILAILILGRRNTILSEGTRNIVRTMELARVKRFVCESSLGVGDSSWKMGVIHNLIAITLFLRNIFADKEVQEQIIASSKLDWVIVRPAALTNGKQRNVYRAGSGIGHWFILYLRQTPGLAY